MITLQPATVNDIDTIAQMAKRIWHAVYTEIVTVAQIDYMLGTMYSPLSMQAQLASGDDYFLIKTDDTPIGYLHLQNKGDGNYFLSKFYIDNNQRGKNVGQQAFTLLLPYYPSLKTIRLQVNRKNYKAINFYFKVGFTIETAQDFDIGQGYLMEDFVMVWNK